MARLTIILLLAAVLAACSERSAAPPAQPLKGSFAGDPAAGRSAAERQCFACHRADGTGAAPGIPQLAQQSEAYLVQSLQQYSAGTRVHAVLAEMTTRLSEVDIRNLAAFYASLPPLADSAAKPEAGSAPYERGRAAAQACTGCHGADGNSTIAGTPSLAGQQPLYLLSALAEYHRSDRSAPGLATMLRSADRVELESLALYYAAQTPAPRAPAAVGDAAVGATLALRCAGCHGIRGVSNDAATPTLAGQDPQYLVKALGGYAGQRHHASMQRQFGNLGEQDVRNIAAYYAAQKSQPAHPTRDPVAPLVDRCNRCHGQPAGMAATPIPRIRGQDKDYLIIALRAYRDDRRASSTMHKMSLPVSEALIDGIASYYASQAAR